MATSDSTGVVARIGVVLSGAYLIAAAFAFWPSYFARLGEVPNVAVHVHGWLMAGWLVLLATQAALIQSGRPALHRSLGRFSFALAPAVALSIALAAHSAVSRRPVDDGAAARVALQLGYVPLFLTIYALGIRHRSDRGRHARLMLCTMLPMTSPVFDRILGFYSMPSMAFLPQFVDGSRLLPLIYVLLLAAALWDWRSYRRLDVFPLVAAFFAIQHTAVLLLYRAQWWHAVVSWFAELAIT